MKKGFTLIELLVVVLIIGILSAIALPKYQRAVWKARAIGMLPIVRSLHEAQNRYFMANGHYAIRFSDLDMSFDSLPIKLETWDEGDPIPSTDAVRANDLYVLLINATNSRGGISLMKFRQGPYKGLNLGIVQRDGALWSDMKKGDMICIFPGKGCVELFGATELIDGDGGAGWNTYKLSF